MSRRVWEEDGKFLQELTCDECGDSEIHELYKGCQNTWYGEGSGRELCRDCAYPVPANPDEEHQQLQDRMEMARQENMIADVDLAA